MVDPQGFVITNFHVIAELVHKPGQYRGYQFERWPVNRLELLDIDASVHDLALLKMDAGTDQYLTSSALGKQRPRRTAVFSEQPARSRFDYRRGHLQRSVG
ncbi:MAG: hypothetical protein R3F37_03420 [Candidatus Competibacteraceae bacterium]